MALKGKQINVPMDEELFQAIADEAEAQDVPRAQVIRQAVKQVLGERPTTVSTKEVE
jgi:metal-responsive CopG/Arc/MetJ family transcriptional regulator